MKVQVCARWKCVLSLCAVLLLALVGAACDGANGDDDDQSAGDDDAYVGNDDDYNDDDGGWSDDDADDDGYYDDDSWVDDDAADDDYGDDDDSWVDDDSSADDDTTPDYDCPDTIDPTVLYLSADDSNSQASPVIVRAIIRKGHLVRASKVRTYEFTNYYQIDYSPPPAGHIHIKAQMRARLDGELPNEYVLQIGAQSQHLSRDQGRPMNLVLSLDNSGSMEGTSIELLRHACRAIASQLREGDVLSIVTWNQDSNVVLDSHIASGPNDPLVLEVINQTHAGGTTDLHQGLVTAYQLANNNYDTERLNRVVLISDGQANTGVTDIEIIANAANDEEREGVYLVGVGVGDPDEYYHDTLMDDVTDAGKGAYVYIDSEEEAALQFGERFMQNMELAAMDVRVELTMPYYMLMEEFHGEDYGGDPIDVEPQHLGPNDAMIFHQYLLACDGDLFNPNDPLTVEAQYVDPFTREPKSDSSTATLGDLLEADARQLLKGDAVVSYAEALKKIADLIYSDRAAALELCRAVKEKVLSAADELEDGELYAIADLLADYENTIEYWN